VIVLWHNGSYYPIAVSADGVVTTLVQTVDTAVDTAVYYAAFLVALAAELDETVQYEVNSVYYKVIKNPYVRPLLGLVNDPYGYTCSAVNVALYPYGVTLNC
jgi:Flp pilus assembly protein TadG